GKASVLERETEKRPPEMEDAGRGIDRASVPGAVERQERHLQAAPSRPAFRVRRRHEPLERVVRVRAGAIDREGKRRRREVEPAAADEERLDAAPPDPDVLREPVQDHTDRREGPRDRRAQVRLEDLAVDVHDELRPPGRAHSSPLRCGPCGPRQSARMVTWTSSPIAASSPTRKDTVRHGCTAATYATLWM